MRKALLPIIFCLIYFDQASAWEAYCPNSFKNHATGVFEHLIKGPLGKVLAEGQADGQHVTFSTNKTRKVLNIETPRGSYQIYISDKTVKSELGHTVAHLEPTDNGRVVGQIFLHPDWLSSKDLITIKYTRGLIRSLFASDEYIHAQLPQSHQRPRDYYPSEYQVQTLAQLAEVRKKSREKIRNSRGATDRLELCFLLQGRLAKRCWRCLTLINS